MDFIQVQAYLGLWSGAVIMISFHNMIVSTFLYKARQTNASNLLKIFFNFAQLVRSSASFGLYMTPKVATISQCTALQHTQMVGNVLTRLALSAFLLWRLRQIRNVKNDRMDKFISIILFTAKVALAIPYLVSQRTSTLYVPEVDYIICDVNDTNPLPYGFSGVVVEFFIDVFITIRLVQILRNANRNASQVTSNIKSKRSLFTAVMYWNFLRLFVAFVFHFTAILDMFTVPFFDEVASITVKSIIYLTLSYVITVDAEIVRVIEGKDKKKGSSAGTEKSFKSMSSPRTPRHYNGHSSDDLPRYSSHTQSYSNHSQIEENKIAVVSMKRLSFFEWANVVVGSRLQRNKNEGQYDEDEYDDEYDDEDIEEIIDGPSKPDDIEKDYPQDRRSSSFSGTTSATETSTLDGNPDIVIN